jgi:hypothetical protein
MLSGVWVKHVEEAIPVFLGIVLNVIVANAEVATV